MSVVVRRYIDILTIIINFPYYTSISSFFGSNIPTSLFIFKCFFGLVYLIFLQYTYKQTLLKEHSRSLKKIEMTGTETGTIEPRPGTETRTETRTVITRI